MRFARQSSIFRGPLDPTPVVSVLFLLVLFMVVGSLLYTPGVVLSLGSTALDAAVITVARNGDIIFDGKTNRVSDLSQLRSGDLKRTFRNRPFQLQADPDADPKVVEQVRAVFQIQLPTGAPRYLTATDNPTVRVAMNFRGQYFFENRLVQDNELRDELRHRLEETKRTAQELTLVLEADKAAENEMTMHLYQLARDAGIKEILLVERIQP